MSTVIIYGVLIILVSNIVTGIVAHKLGYRAGVKDENWRWRTDINISKMPYSGLFGKQ